MIEHDWKPIFAHTCVEGWTDRIEQCGVCSAVRYRHGHPHATGYERVFHAGAVADSYGCPGMPEVTP